MNDQDCQREAKNPAMDAYQRYRKDPSLVNAAVQAFREGSSRRMSKRETREEDMDTPSPPKYGSSVMRGMAYANQAPINGGAGAPFFELPSEDEDVVGIEEPQDLSKKVERPVQKITIQEKSEPVKMEEKVETPAEVQPPKKEYDIVMDKDVIVMGKFMEDSLPEKEYKNYAWEFGKEKDNFKVTLGRTTQFKVS